MGTLGAEDTQPDASQCLVAVDIGACFSMSAEAAVAEVSIPCMEPILQMCMKGSAVFFFFFPACICVQLGPFFFDCDFIWQLNNLGSWHTLNGADWYLNGIKLDPLV